MSSLVDAMKFSLTLFQLVFEEFLISNNANEFWITGFKTSISKIYDSVVSNWFKPELALIYLLPLRAFDRMAAKIDIDIRFTLGKMTGLRKILPTEFLPELQSL